MKNLGLLFSLLLLQLVLSGQIISPVNNADQSKYLLGEVNPLEVQKIVLPNGLTVYLNEDHSKPEIYGAIIVKAGSRHDPQDATGIAHYFEHIMFKGTDRIGTIDWESEKVYLDSISTAYDQLALTSDQNKRIAIQQDINRLSIKAAEFAIPNETDVLLRDIGGNNLNAGTGHELTVYYNTLPSYQLEKWMEIYSERFRNPVFRLFQSELETVYEEKNLYSDVPVQGMIEDFMKNLYGEHPYSNPILGQTEHLKNPQLSKMMEFYNTWYVANNMALILSGSFDAAEVIPMIKEKFGKWRSGELPSIPEYELPPFKGREFSQVRMSPIRIGLMGYRGIPKGHPDNPIFDVATRLLSNGSGTGIFDKMMMDNKVMTIVPISMQAPDHGSYLVLFVPKIVGQKLRNAESMVDDGIGLLRDGEFSDELLQAVKLEYRKDIMLRMETPKNRADLIMDAFIEGREWEEVLTDIDRIEQVSKEDIMRVAETYLGNDRLVYWSKMGFPKKDKLEKPNWKPVIPQNTESRSDFAQMINEMDELAVDPVFVEFGKDVRFDSLNTGNMFYYTNNPYNEIFTLRINFHKGILNSQLLAQTSTYMNLIGTEEKTFNKFKGELQNLGASISFSASDNFFTVNVKGFDGRMEATLKLLAEILEQPQADESQLEKLWQDAKANNKMRRNDPMAIGNALYNFALYNEKSSDIRNITYKELKQLKGEDLIAAFKDATGHEATVFYTGSIAYDMVREQISKAIPWKQIPDKTEFIELQRKAYEANTLYINHNNKARQSNINFYVEGTALPDVRKKAHAVAFNEYFGSGMSSLVFQEIREFRSLSYAAYAVYRQARINGNHGHLMAYMNTQSDKTIQGIEAMSELIIEMPLKPERIEGIRKGLMQSTFTSRPEFRDLGFSVAQWRRQGYEKDPSELHYPIFKELEFNQIVDFYKHQINNRPMVITISGNMKTIDKKVLESFGKTIELKFDDFIRE